MSAPTYESIAAKLRRLSDDMLKADGTARDGYPVGLSLIRALPFTLGVMAADIEYLEREHARGTDRGCRGHCFCECKAADRTKAGQE